ncbi:hypothetical protein TorRG33x02_275830 [Trema orientale]|uniref:Uncharacterized protein n=1 Tax=Trema orientale TaxID=63057 RepID=A0A2P5CRC7_TREOI|nr:hypothetical protein TorRG33x02_275830 [Trema orientale]
MPSFPLLWCDRRAFRLRARDSGPSERVLQALGATCFGARSNLREKKESCTTQAASSLHEVEEDSSLSASAGWSDPSLSGSWRATYICILERSETHKIFQKMFPPHQVYYDALRLRDSQVSPSL